MRKLLLIILFFVLTVFIKNVNAQTTGVPDTLAYLQTILANKAFYISKPFSVLKDSLKIQINFFSPNSSIVYDITKETSTSFGFYSPQNEDEMYLTYPHLLIYWQPYLNATQSRALYNSGVGWSSTVVAFYGTGIVTDIQIRE